MTSTASPRTFTDLEGHVIPGMPTPEPCPFCGNVGLSVTRAGNPDATYHVACWGCGCDGPTDVTVLAAAVAWNRRIAQ